MQPNYMSMSGYGYGQGYPGPLALTQPEPLPSWMPEPVAPVQRTFPMASAAAPGPVVDPMAPGFGNGGWLGSFEDMAPAVSAAAPAGGNGIQWFNTRDQQGVLGPALQGAQTLANLYMGMKQYGIAKDQLNFQRDSFNKQYAANQSLTNSRLADRQARRVLENPNATPVADYMSKWGVK